MAAEGTDLSVVLDRSAPLPLLRLAGDLDIEAAADLTETLKSVLADVGSLPLVLDLTDVEFMDSSGLGVLVGAHKEAAAVGGQLILAAPHPRVAKILRITKLHKVFTIHPTVDDALAAVSVG